MNAPTKTSRSIRTSTGLLFLVFWIVLIILALYNRQGITDWWALRHYQAPAVIAQLATQDTMTADARNIFYVNQPELQPKASFKDCNLGKEQAAILGCYHSNQAGIFILDVSDARLNGIEQVTAAHEMLHAAYDRLNTRQKKSVDVMLEDYYQHDLKDPDIIAQMNAYKKSEPQDVVDEMHSVFGTEVTKLPAPLEQYYSKYFTSRKTVAGFYTKYEAEFSSRQDAVKADDARLAAMKKQIDDEQSDLQKQYAALTAQQARLTGYKQNGDIGDYNAGVPGFNRLVNSYNTQVDALRGLIAQYNELVNTRNGIALEAQQLTNEITSQVSPIGQ